MFIDEAVIVVESGKGGDGAVHFRREKFVPLGGPDGGDGGRGGDIILQVSLTLNTLSTFQHRKNFNAEDGKRGGGNNRTGKSGKNLTILVPPGTVIFEEETGDVFGDLIDKEDRVIICKGGRGGRGNSRFATSRNQAPRIGERGEPGEKRILRLELKLIADIGIIGVPNAGKSTFLAVVTNAKPKIASYPFTTLQPNLGVAALDEDTSLILADIPGLIEGAHEGIGLGHAFLRHIQRTRVLIHLLDGMAEDPVLDFAQINSELALFDPMLAEKPQVVAFNKMDLPDVQARYPEIVSEIKSRGIKNIEEIIPISAVAGTNVRKLLFRALKLLEEAPDQIDLVELPVYSLENDPREFSIKRTSDGWLVIGHAIERAAAMTYWEYDQSIRRFQRILESLGIDAALIEAGVKAGDTVHIGEYELVWQD